MVDNKEKRNKILTWLAAGLILLTMFLIAFFSSKGAFGDPGDSAIVDEVAHIPAGYTYDKDLDFRLNPEHPPLVKALAGLPLVLNKSINGPESGWAWGAANQWEAGWYMLYNAGNDPKQILFWSRLPMMLLMVVLGIFLFKWAVELFGRKVGLVVLLLFAFYPDVIAHGRLVTTDIAAALAYVVSMYYFTKALEKKTWQAILIAALAFGVGQCLKFSAFLLFIVFGLLVLVRAGIDARENKNGYWYNLWKGFKVYFWTSLLSLIVVLAIYLPFVWKTPAVIEHQLINVNLTDDPRVEPLKNFLYHFEGNPFFRAVGHYMLGIILVIGRVGGGNNTFIMGAMSFKSIPWFFSVAWLLKTPIPIIILTFASTILLFVNYARSRKNIWTLSVILAPVIVYWTFTLKGSLDIGIRHLMPTVPFVLLFIGYTIYPVLNSVSKNLYVRASKVMIGILLVYMVISTLANYPSYISYFNEFTPREERYQRLIDSSLDWGQDLLRLKKYTDENNISDIKIDYFGGSQRLYYFPKSTEWHSENGPTTGWIAISATFYQSSKLVGEKEGKWSYGWLDNIKPTKIIGDSILVFHITDDDLIKHPPVSPYPITKVVSPATNVGLENRVGL
ncbi:MAG: glycosyltransferase family 39 protein [Candidatus Berkelbacteria bacterium]